MEIDIDAEWVTVEDRKEMMILSNMLLQYHTTVTHSYATKLMSETCHMISSNTAFYPYTVFFIEDTSAALRWLANKSPNDFSQEVDL